MSDIDLVGKLTEYASDANRLQAAQRVAAAKLLAFDGETFPSDGCAITLSTLLQDVGIDVPDIYKAIDLGRHLEESRGWARIDVGDQQEGDVGSTCGDQANHGFDHIYLVLKPLNADEMVVADNQEPMPHFRYASGGGRAPTKFFLRAPA